MSISLFVSLWSAATVQAMPMPLTNSQKAVEVLTYLGTKNRQPLSYIRSDYIQHNLSAETGLDGLKKFLSTFPTSPKPSGLLLRVLTDGPYVIVHSRVPPNLAVFDIFRFENGEIVEHWDNLAPISGKTPGGHTQTDGLLQPYDFTRTYANKLLVLQAMNDIFVDGDLSAVDQYVASDIVEHEAGVADGLNAFKQALQQKITDKKLSYAKVEAVLGQGNLIVAVSSGTMNDKPMAFYDLFRITGNHIDEHWSVDSVIPPKSQWKNNNGKFNFPFGALPLDEKPETLSYINDPEGVDAPMMQVNQGE
jgi:predicted SnoaL-like aldol condensation-catalyzing enzyme